MKTTLTAIALAAALAQPATAITFSSLTTIYVGSGVTDNGDPAGQGVATTFICSNVSGVTTTIRFLVLNFAGDIVSSTSFSPVPHGDTRTVSTHDTTTFNENVSFSGIGVIDPPGVLNIESLQSGVFCTAYIVDAAEAVDIAPVHLVRVNPHPGTVE